jgi:hypothetical protein
MAFLCNLDSNIRSLQQGELPAAENKTPAGVLSSIVTGMAEDR